MSKIKKPVFLIVLFGAVFLLGFYAGASEVMNDLNGLRSGISDAAEPDNEEEANEGEQQASEEQVPEEESKVSDEEMRMIEAIKRHEESIIIGPNGMKFVTNVLDNLVLVNKEFNLPADYIPPDLVVPDIPFLMNDERRYMREEAARALEELVAAAKEDQVELVGISGYRSYITQERIFANNVKRRGSEEIANKSSARPGQSEHQTGLAMDVSSASVDYALSQMFSDTKEGQWLVKNAPEYGFIIRFPKGKEHITGYIYEPWHLRYVSVEHAKVISEENLTLEEYLQQH